MKQIVWHRLNDIKIFYKNVLEIELNFGQSSIDIINTRHHIIRRNGFDLEGTEFLFQAKN